MSETYTVNMHYIGPQSHDIDGDWGLGVQRGRERGEMGGMERWWGWCKEASSCLQSYLTLGLTLRTDMRRE